jgi:thymidylate synthase (FAD)
MDKNSPAAALEAPDLYTKRPLLDHGYLQLIEPWGSDRRIIESARQSTDKGFLGWEPYSECRRCKLIATENQPRLLRGCGDGSLSHDWNVKPLGDQHLLAYLWKHKHSTPFEFGGLTIEVQAPIMVFREWHRHRVPFGYSELSARYAPMPDLAYLPTVERCLASGGKNKQAGAADFSQPLTDAAAEAWLVQLQDLYAHAQLVYQTGLNVGIPKEIARLAVTVGRYSRMRATGNLRGWLSFLALRHAPGAQHEIRVYAQQVDQLLEQCFPRTMQVVRENGG